jgi:hypothetical protein
MSKRIITVNLSVLVFAMGALGQGTFQNLDFEAARLVFVGLTQQIATSNALPGWTAYSAGSPLSYVTYNTFSAVPKVGLYGSNSYVLSGVFGVSLSSGGVIAQTGVVPSDCESLRFKASWFGLAPKVSLGGLELLFVPISNNQNYTVYGADISGFAGRTSDLAFSTTVGGYEFLIDDIKFSPLPIPEPSALALSGLGALCFATRWVRRRGKRGG